MPFRLMIMVGTDGRYGNTATEGDVPKTDIDVTVCIDSLIDGDRTYIYRSMQEENKYVSMDAIFVCLHRYGCQGPGAVLVLHRLSTWSNSAKYYYIH